MNKSEALQIIGGLSNPAKLPCSSYSLPATACKVGSRLFDVAGSTCEGCYARKGCYRFPVVQTALERRLEAITHKYWVPAMVAAIGRQSHFRWHDSGDLQGIDHLTDIARVCKDTPNTAHWLPTRETKLVRQYMRCNAPPPNLGIRISAAMVDGKPPAVASDWTRTVNTSTVHRDQPAQGFACTSPLTNSVCGDCRACWDPEISNISYQFH